MDTPDRVENKDQQHISTRSVRPFAIHLDRTPVEGAGDAKSGNLTWKTLISADRMPSAEMVLGIANFPPHGKLNLHRHCPAEIYFGLSGAGTVTVDGETFGIAQGVAIFIPSNCEHGVVAGDAGLSLAYCFAQDAFGDIEYRYTNPGAEERSIPGTTT
ncbi:MAG TPA: cupin domain-containing protein [Steroidobacteraceae bacterium]|nr:cupin domain-containing protein [Steroidobacteraceae bacterium]